MKGLELSEAFYREYGEPMLLRDFPKVLPKIAVGLAGAGSDAYGYDDETSADHDFEPGFCIFLPGEETVDRRTAFLLERAYSRLPKEFRGYRRSPMSPVGGNRHGVIRLSDFLLRTVGSEDGRIDLRDLLRLPESYLFEATDGKLFRDDSGLFTKIREELRVLPEDVRLKKLAACLLLMEQAGPYNYPRCLRHGEDLAAQTALFRFAENAVHALFLLNGALMPYYKWAFRALRDLPDVPDGTEERIRLLLTSGNGPEEALRKEAALNEILLSVGRMLEERGLLSGAQKTVSGSPLQDPREAERQREARGTVFFTERDGRPIFDAERAAYQVNDRISDPGIRNLHILYTAD